MAGKGSIIPREPSALRQVTAQRSATSCCICSRNWAHSTLPAASTWLPYLRRGLAAVRRTLPHPSLSGTLDVHLSASMPLRAQEHDSVSQNANTTPFTSRMQHHPHWLAVSPCADCNNTSEQPVCEPCTGLPRGGCLSSLHCQQGEGQLHGSLPSTDAVTQRARQAQGRTGHLRSSSATASAPDSQARGPRGSACTARLRSPLRLLDSAPPPPSSTSFACGRQI